MSGRLFLAELLSVAAIVFTCRVPCCADDDPADAATNAATPADDGDKLAESIRNPECETAESFGDAALAIVKSRKLLGLTRAEIEKTLGKPSFSDWFFNLGKPRFMGDHLHYELDVGPTGPRPRLGVYLRDGKVCSCYFGTFEHGKHIGKIHQESAGKPIRWTIN